MNNYIIIEGLDGSGSSYTYNQLLKTGKFSYLSQDYYLREKRYNDNNKWWEANKVEIENRFKFYIQRNFRQNEVTKKILKENHVIQLKSFVTTLIVHSYFLKKQLSEVLVELNLVNNNNLVKAHKIFAIYAPSKLRNERFLDRKIKGELTEFDLITLSEDYEKFWLKSIGELAKSNIFGEIILLYKSNSDIYETKISHNISNLSNLKL